MKYSKIKFLAFFAIICSIGLVPINDVSAATTFVDAKDVSDEDTIPSSLAFNTDGTKMFVAGRSGDNIYEYACTTGFDVSSCSVVVGGEKDISSEETAPEGLAFNNDGTKMFVVGSSGDDVNEYACTAFDVSTCSFTDAFLVSTQETGPSDLAFNSDGTKMFVTGFIGDDVDEYTLSVGFDLNTAPSGSDCYDCTPPTLQSAHVTISSNDYVVATGDEPVHITANVGDKVTILLNVTDDKPVDTIPFAALYTNFEQKPSDMNLFYANNHDNQNKVSTSFYEWNIRADDISYDYDGTVSWSDNTPTVVTDEITEDNFKFKNSNNVVQHLAIPFTFTINGHMDSKIVAEIYDANANRLQVTLPIILKTAGNDPLDFENMGKQKVLGFFNESVLNTMILELNGSEDTAPLSEFLGIPEESLPAWTLDLATWVADEKIDSADLIVAVEYLINQ